MKKIKATLAMLFCFSLLILSIASTHPFASSTAEASSPVAITTINDVCAYSSMLNRAEEIVNFEWVPSERIDVWNENPYNGKMYFEAGETVKGIPYTLFSWELGFDSLLSLEQYKSKSAANYSTTKYCNSVKDTRTGPVYGNCCATFVSEVFGGLFMNGSNPRYDGVGTVRSSDYATTYYDVQMSALQPGDALSCTSGAHIVWIAEIADQTITIYESTPPVCQKVILDKASHTDSNGYLIYEDNTYNIVTKSNQIIRDDLLTVADFASDIPLPLHAYTKTEDKTVVYDTVNGTAKSNKIYGTDLCFIDAVFDNGWCHVNFPLDAGGLEHGYVQTSVFFDAENITSATTDFSITAYKRNDFASSIGRVPLDSTLFYLTETDDAYQIAYPSTSGGYNLGWISKEDLENGAEDVFLNQLCPIKGYPCVTENFEVKESDYVTRGGEIYTSDYCTINEVYSDGWCQVTFPMTSGGTRTAYTEISNFIKTPSATPTKYIASEYINLYSTSSLTTQLYRIYPEDVCYTIGTSGSATQIFMPMSGGNYYVLGWVSTSDLDGSAPSDTPDADEQLNPGLMSLSASSYAKCYTISDTQYAVYTSSDLITRGYEGTASATAWTGENDEIWIIGVGVNSTGTAYARIQYPVGSSRYTAYVPLHSMLVPGSLTDTYRTSTAKVTGLSDRAGGTSNSAYWVDAGEKVYLLSQQNGYSQILYPISSTEWRIAWCSNDVYDSMFQAQTYTVIYDLNGGTGALTTQTKAHGESIILCPVNITRPGYTFMGWATTSSATEPTYYPGSVYSTNASMILYAVWQKNPATLESVLLESLPLKTVYQIGDSLETDGLILQLLYSDGTTESVSNGYLVSGFTSETAGVKTVTVSYNDKETTFTVIVEEPVVLDAQYNITDVSGTAGSTIEIYVSITNNPGIISLRNTITYDSEVLELIEVKDSKILNGYTAPSPQMISPYILRWADSLAKANNIENGIIATLVFKIKDDAIAGSYDVSVSPIESRNIYGDKIEFKATSATVTVIDYVIGDVDDDGEISDWDAILLNRYLSGWDITINTYAADTDGDGEISDWDAILLERYLGGWEIQLG